MAISKRTKRNYAIVNSMVVLLFIIIMLVFVSFTSNSVGIYGCTDEKANKYSMNTHVPIACAGVGYTVYTTLGELKFGPLWDGVLDLFYTPTPHTQGMGRTSVLQVMLSGLLAMAASGMKGSSQRKENNMTASVRTVKFVQDKTMLTWGTVMMKAVVPNRNRAELVKAVEEAFIKKFEFLSRHEDKENDNVWLLLKGKSNGLACSAQLYRTGTIVAVNFTEEKDGEVVPWDGVLTISL